MRVLEGEKEELERVATNGRDELNENGKRLLTFAANNKLALTNTLSSMRKGGVSHTHNGTGRLMTESESTTSTPVKRTGRESIMSSATRNPRPQ